MTDNTNQSPIDDLFFKSIVDGYMSNSRFIRRDWLTDEMAEQLKDPDCRFVLHTAEPGAGKSGFMAQLAHDHPDWARYFIRRDQKDVLMGVGVHSFLLRIGYQLAIIYPELFTQEQLKIAVEQRIGTVQDQGEVIGAEVKRLLASPFYSKVLQIKQDIQRNKGTVIGIKVEELIIDPRLIDQKDLQYMALIDPAVALLKREPTKQIVVIVDALDEARYHGTEGSLLKWLIDCPELPQNVRFILTSRPPEGEVVMFQEKKQCYIKHLTINSQDGRIQRELKVYVEKLVSIPEVNKTLSTTTSRVEDFSKEVMEKADGNIGYLDAIARGIDHALSVKEKKEEEGTSLLKGLLTLEELPKDTQELYGFFLHQIKNSPSIRDRSIRVRYETTGKDHFLSVWTEVYKPMLGVLSVAFEPLTIDQIYDLGNIFGSRDEVIEAKEWLRQFLDEEEGRYRFYHGTVQEFLASAKTREKDETTDLYIDPLEWHRSVADSYWKANHKHWSKLTDHYGLNYLARHLFEGHDPERLFSLISKEWMEARSRGSHTTFGFQTDVDLAWSVTVEPKEPNLVRMVRLRSAHCVAKEYERFFTNKDLETLVLLKRLSEALIHTRMRKDPEQIFEGLMTIFRNMCQGEPQVEAILDEAEEIAGKIDNMVNKAYAYCSLGAAFVKIDDIHSNKLFKLTEEVIDGIDNEPGKIQCLYELAIQLACIGNKRAKEFFLKSVRIACSLSDNSSQTLLSNLTSDLSSPELFNQAEDLSGMIQSIKNISARDESLGYLAKAFSKLKQFKEAEEVITYINDSEKKFEPLMILAENLVEKDKNWAIKTYRQAKIYADTNPNPMAKAYQLGCLAADMTKFDSHKSSQLFKEAFSAAKSIGNKWNQSYALRHLATNLMRAGQFTEAGEIASTIQDPLLKDDLLREAVFFFSKSGQLHEARKIVRSIHDPQIQIAALQDMTDNLLKQKHFKEAEETIQEIQLEKFRAEAIKKLVVSLAREGFLDQAIQIVRSVPVNKTRVETLRELGAILAMKDDSRGEEILLLAISEAMNQNEIWRRDNALHDLAYTISKTGLYDIAENILSMINSSKLKIDGLCIVGKLLAQAGDKHAVDIYHLVKNVYEKDFINEVSVSAGEKRRIGILREVDIYIHKRLDEELLEISKAMTQAGFFELAEEMTEKIFQKEIRDIAISNMTVKNHVTGRPDTDKDSNQSKQHIADALAKEHRYDEALLIMAPESMDDFLCLISGWISYFPKNTPNLPVAVLSEAIGVATWGDPFWAKIYQLLQSYHGI